MRKIPWWQQQLLRKMEEDGISQSELARRAGMHRQQVHSTLAYRKPHDITLIRLFAAAGLVYPPEAESSHD